MLTLLAYLLHTTMKTMQVAIASLSIRMFVLIIRQLTYYAQAKAMPGLPIYGGKPDNGPLQVKAVNKVIKDGDKITLGDSITIT